MKRNKPKPKYHPEDRSLKPKHHPVKVKRQQAIKWWEELEDLQPTKETTE